MASTSGWQSVNQDEIDEWRRDLPKGAIRESNTARTVGYDVTESDGDQAVLDSPSTGPVPLARTAPPREVAEDIYGLMWKWAQGSRENFQLMARMVRHNNPNAFGHLSDDELATKLETHAKDAARAATENVYQGDNKWDRGNDLDQMQGKPVTP